MSEMKLIMENWRRFEKGPDAGILCLFENRRVRRAPFAEVLNSIGNTEKELDLFLEKWEKSLNYELKRINEGWEDEARNQAAEHGEEVPKGAENSKWGDFKEDPVLYLSTQVFLFIQKAKEDIIKHIPKILGFINKIKSVAKKFEKKHPTIYKIGMTTSKVAIAMVAIYAVNSILGGDQAMAGDVVDYKGNVMANEQQLQMLGKALSNSQDVDYQKAGQLMLDIANSAENVRGDVGRAGIQIAMPDSEINHDIFNALRNGLEHGTDKLNQAVADGNLSSEYSNLADSALELLKTVPDPPPIADISAPGATSGTLDITDVFDQIEAKIQMRVPHSPDQLKLLKLAAEKETNPELKARAQELLSQIK